MTSSGKSKSKVFSSFGDLLANVSLPPAEAATLETPASVATPVVEKKTVEVKHPEPSQGDRNGERGEGRGRHDDSRHPKSPRSVVKQEPRNREIFFPESAFRHWVRVGWDQARRREHAEATLSFSKAIDLGLDFIRQVQERGALHKHRGNLDGAMQGYDVIADTFRRMIPIFYDRGRTRYALKDLEGALRDYDMVVKYEPQHRRIHLKRSLLKKLSGDREGAILDLKEALRHAPHDSDLHYRLAFLKKEQGDEKVALEEYGRGLSRDPHHPMRDFQKAQFFLKKGNASGALQALDRCLSKIRRILNHFVSPDPEHFKERFELAKRWNLPLLGACARRAEIHRMKGNAVFALEDYSQLIALDPSDFHSLLVRGELREEQGDYAGAVQDYSVLIQQEPQKMPLVLKRAHALALAKEFQKALADYSAVLQKEPYSIPVYLKRSQVRSALADWEGAEKDLSTVIEFKPSAFDLYYQRAKIRREKRDLEGLTLDFQKALLLDPESPNRCFEEGEKFRSEKKMDSALSVFDQGVQKSAKLFEEFGDASLSILEFCERFQIKLLGALLNRADLRKMKQDWAGTLEDLGAILKQEPNHLPALLLRAETELLGNNLKAALHDCNQALQVNARADQAFLLRARILSLKKDFDEASKDFQKAIKLSPSNADHQARFGIFLYERELWESALFSLRKAWDLDNTHAEANHVLANLYASCPMEKLRDPREALKHALRACEKDKNPETLRTLSKAQELNGLLNGLHAQKVLPVS